MHNTVERLHFMDSMRAVLMLLGVVLHSAQVFNQSQSWLIFSNNNDPLLNHLVSIISTFRMPAFFVVSGYFCFLTLSKYKARKFLSVRLKRIIVPFVFSACLLNSLQMAFLDWSGWLKFELVEYILKGGYVSHLWFLINLIVYFIVASVLVTFFKPLIKLIGKLASNIIKLTPMSIVVAVLPLLSIMIDGLNKIGFPLYSSFFGLFETYSIFKYSPYFIFGTIIATNNDFLRRVSTTNPILCLTIIMISILLTSYLESNEYWFSIIAVTYFNALSRWFAVLLCFYIFYRYFNTASKMMLYLSDASYSVYLFHQFFVVTVGTLLISLNFPAILGAFTLILVVTVTTLFIHTYIISKNKVLLFMFNGK